MKTSLIKKTARTFFLVQAVMLVTSCSNFLNIDNYFDDEFNIDSVFTNARYMEAYMWGAAAMFPDEAQTIRNGYTPGPMATDEGFNGLTGSGTANIYHGMDFANGKITQDFLGDGSPNLNQWGKYYKIIRKCNSILQNLDRPRATYDETMNYTCEEFEKAARLLPSPQDVSTLDFGRPTKGAALGLVARLRLIHASPLFNGGPVASSYFGNWKRKTDGVHYVSQQYDESRWAVAAAAAKRVMDMGAYKLYTYAKDDNTPELPAGVTSDPNFYDAYPNGANGIDPFKSYSDIFTGEAVASINPELIWGRNTTYLNETISKGSFPPSMGGWGRFCVTQKVVDAYLMDDGRTKEEAAADGYYSETGFTSEPRNFSGYPLNAGVYKMYANREMRFYASVGFNEAVWQALSSSTLNNHTAKYYYQDEDGRGGVTATSPNYPITGYVIKKYNNPMDAWTGTGARHIQKAYPIIRYAEILLSYAEALNNLTGPHTVELDGQPYTMSRDKEEIKKAFNQVRYRAGLPGLTANQLNSTPEVQKQIERERMVEFLWENRRFYDVRRWGIYEETEQEPIRGMNPDGATKETYYQRVIPSSSSFLTRVVDKRSVWVPIPRNEMRRLPSLDQNPGY